MPTTIAATNTNTLGDSVTRLTSAGPGQSPTRPQPMPNSTAPATSGASMSRAGRPEALRREHRAAAPLGERRSRATDTASAAAITTGSSGPRAGRDAGEIEKVENLGRLRHARDQKAEAEQQTATKHRKHRHGSAPHPVTHREHHDGRRGHEDHRRHHRARRQPREAADAVAGGAAAADAAMPKPTSRPPTTTQPHFGIAGSGRLKRPSSADQAIEQRRREQPAEKGDPPVAIVRGRG